MRGDGQNQDARDLVERLRADRPAGYESWINGDAARMIDLNTRLQAGLPLAVLIVVLAMTILLFLMTGSVVVSAQGDCDERAVARRDIRCAGGHIPVGLVLRPARHPRPSAD